MRKNQKGFTLMELMVVIVIVAILAAVAAPLYTNYVKDSKRTEAKGAIGAVITAEQTYYQKAITGGSGTYTNSVGSLNVDTSDTDGKWTITIPAATATSFKSLGLPSSSPVPSIGSSYHATVQLSVPMVAPPYPKELGVLGCEPMERS